MKENLTETEKKTKRYNLFSPKLSDTSLLEDRD